MPSSTTAGVVNISSIWHPSAASLGPCAPRCSLNWLRRAGGGGIGCEVFLPLTIDGLYAWYLPDEVPLAESAAYRYGRAGRRDLAKSKKRVPSYGRADAHVS